MFSQIVVSFVAHYKAFSRLSKAEMMMMANILRNLKENTLNVVNTIIFDPAKRIKSIRSHSITHINTGRGRPEFGI